MAFTAGCAGLLKAPQRFLEEAGTLETPDGGDVSVMATADAACSAASAAQVPETVFVANCAVSGCHNPTDQAGSLDLKSSDVAARLVGVSAHDGPGVYVAKSGDPSMSDLYLLLTPGFPFDDQMPLGGPFLDAESLACVRSWIQSQAPRSKDAGDQNDANVHSSRDGSVSSADAVAPADGGVD